MKIFYLIIFLLIFSSDIYTATLMEKLNMPSDKIYISHLKISLNTFKKDTPIQSKKSLNPQLTNGITTRRFILKGIVKFKDKFIAIVNGKTFVVGDNISDYTIKKIDIDKIELFSEKNQERLVVRIEK